MVRLVNNSEKQNCFAELLNKYRSVTSGMTTDKYGYLIRHFSFFRPFIAVKLNLYRKQGASEELLRRIEYDFLFSIFEKRLECDWKVSNCRIKENVGLKEYADAILIKYCERELYDYRCYTSEMTPEKYAYLCKKYKIISNILDRLDKKYKESGVNEELLLRKKYYTLFGIYEDSYERTWTSLNWGIKENESLASFADGALHQEAHGIK